MGGVSRRLTDDGSRNRLGWNPTSTSEGGSSEVSDHICLVFDLKEMVVLGGAYRLVRFIRRSPGRLESRVLLLLFIVLGRRESEKSTTPKNSHDNRQASHETKSTKSNGAER